MKMRFLIASEDEPVSAWPPVVVSADNMKDAIDRYMRVVYSKDPIFRDNVLDLSINGSFVEKFFFATAADDHSFDTTGRVEYDLDVVKSRVMVFFSGRPDLGDRFVRYMDTREVSHINDEIFEFISAADTSGIVALNLDDIRQV